MWNQAHAVPLPAPAALNPVLDNLVEEVNQLSDEDYLLLCEGLRRRLPRRAISSQNSPKPQNLSQQNTGHSGKSATLSIASGFAAQDKLLSRKPTKITPPVFELLTKRELEVLTLVASGYSRKEIGHTLEISENTAACHIATIYRKLDIGTIAEATRAAIQSGVV